MIRKIISSLVAVMIVAAPMSASAHVVVTPATASVGDYTTFSVSVPNEEESDVTNLKLDIPSGVESVTPTVKPGWTITTQKNGDNVTSITWSDGTIPAGLRDDFTFRAQVPANPTELNWKAYQTYADGTVVHWDQKPNGSDDESGNAGPYSVTKVTNDLAATATTDNSSGSNSNIALIVAVAALVIAVGGILYRKR